jgi:phage-related holin
MEAMYRCINGAILGLAALFAPIKPLILCALSFIIIDFVTGVIASRCEAKQRGEKWFFSSHEAWRTIRKAGFVLLTISMCWLIEWCILDFMTLNLTRILTGAICGVEMWSFLENASVLSDAKLFEWLRNYVKRKVEKEIGKYND